MGNGLSEIGFLDCSEMKMQILRLPLRLALLAQGPLRMTLFGLGCVGTGYVPEGGPGCIFSRAGRPVLRSASYNASCGIDL